MEVYDFGIVIGRLQPLHNSHEKILNFASVICKQVIVVLGSLDANMDEKNPWSFEQRRDDIILPCLKPADRERFHFVGVQDYPGRDPVWLAQVQNKVSQVIDSLQTSGQRGWSDYDSGGQKEPSIAVIGFKKDHSSNYLDWFPQWNLVEVPELLKGISASDIRTALFFEDIAPKEYSEYAGRDSINDVEKALALGWQENVPHSVRKYLEAYKKTPAFAHIQKEFLFNVTYRAYWEGLKHPIFIQTVDAIVEKNGHFVAVIRKNNPGKGCFALPGGHLEKDERLFDAAIRELMEETGIRLPLGKPTKNIEETKKLQIEKWKSYCVGQKTFDDPERSRRGRVITTAFHFKLPDTGPLPRVKGGDDAKEAFWMPYGDVEKYRSKFFEDHASIANYFLYK